MNRTTAIVLQLVFAAVAVVVVVRFAYAVRDGEQRHAPDSLVRYLSPDYVGENRTAPDFDLVDRYGHHHRLSEFRGKTVVLHFWTRTCGPCVQEMQTSIPVFEELVKDRHDVQLVMVTVDSDWNSVAAIVPPGVHSPILFDPTRRVVTGRYGTRLFPETWVIDRDGVIRARFDHAIEWESPLFLNYLSALR